MSNITFELREIPHASDAPLTGYFPAIVGAQHVSAEQVCAEIEEMCTVTSADVKAVLDALAYVIRTKLRSGARVEMEGIGNFLPTITSDEPITKTDDRQTARHLSISGIRFTPKQALTAALEGATFRRADASMAMAVQRTDEEVREIVNAFFTKHPGEMLTRAAFQKITGFRKTRALRTLQALVSDGFLITCGQRNSPYYKLT